MPMKIALKKENPSIANPEPKVAVNASHRGPITRNLDMSATHTIRSYARSAGRERTAHTDSADRFGYGEPIASVTPTAVSELQRSCAGRRLLPRVDYLATGGTIASVPNDHAGG